MASGKRNTNESFIAYRNRLAAQSKDEKAQKNGRVIWDSSRKGTYIREDHGIL